MKYPTTSKTLLGKLRDGDTISWNEFYAKYRSIVFAAGRFKGLSDQECEDLMQEVMIRFFKNSQTFVFDPNIAKFRTYFGKIISGKIIDIIKARKNMFPLDEAALQDNSCIEDDWSEPLQEEWRKLIMEEAEIRLRTKVDTKTFLAYQWSAVQNRPIKEISMVLGINANQIYLAKSRCIKHLRNIVAQLEHADAEGTDHAI